MGGSLTQSAMLHLAHGPYAEELEPLIDRGFTFTQSTSASSLLLASLDLARAGLEDGHDRIAASLAAAAELRDAVRATGRFPIVSDGFGAFADIVDHDPLRVSIDVAAAGLHGHSVREELMRTAGSSRRSPPDPASWPSSGRARRRTRPASSPRSRRCGRSATSRPARWAPSRCPLPAPA